MDAEMILPTTPGDLGMTDGERALVCAAMSAMTDGERSDFVEGLRRKASEGGQTAAPMPAPASIAAAFDLWRQMNDALPTLTGAANEEQCERIVRLEERMLALPVVTLDDLWRLVAATMDPPEAGDFTTEARLARRARIEAGLSPNRF